MGKKVLTETPCGLAHRAQEKKRVTRAGQTSFRLSWFFVCGFCQIVDNQKTGEKGERRKNFIAGASCPRRGRIGGSTSRP